jgi:signal transduction histidine kinase
MGSDEVLPAAPPPATPRWRRSAVIAVAAFVAALLFGAWLSRSGWRPPPSDAEVLHLDRAQFAKTVRPEARAVAGESAPPSLLRPLPDLWRRHDDGDSGYGWYRVPFRLDRVPDGPWAIAISFAHTSLQVQLNGADIAEASDFHDPALEPQSSQPRLVPIPPALLHPGENLIDVRLRVEQDLHGGLSAIDVGPMREVEDRYLADRFWRADLPRALDVTLLVAAAFVLLLWVRRPREDLYPWFAALCTVWALRGFYTSGDGWWLRLLNRDAGIGSHDLFLGSTMLLGCALLLVVVDRYARRPQPTLEYTALAFGVSATLLVAPLGPLGLEPLNGALHAIAAAFALLAARTVVSMTRREPGWGNGLIAAGSAFMLAMAVHDALVADDLIAYTPTNWLVFGPPVLLSTVLLALGGRYFEAFDEAEGLNRELEQRVAERARDIERQYERIAALERAHAIAEERERLMRDMHDGVGSQLMSTLAALERGTLPSGQVGALLRACIDDLRLVIDSLDVGEQSLPAALANLRYRLEPRLEASGLALAWHVDAGAGAQLGPGALLHVLRVVQEALANALEHAQATRISVHVRAQAGELLVEVTDDGIGLPAPGTPVQGRGLANMRQRARSLGGDLETAALSPGTRVCLRIPAATPG